MCLKIRLRFSVVEILKFLAFSRSSDRVVDVGLARIRDSMFLVMSPRKPASLHGSPIRTRMRAVRDTLF